MKDPPEALGYHIVYLGAYRFLDLTPQGDHPSQTKQVPGIGCPPSKNSATMQRTGMWPARLCGDRARPRICSEWDAKLGTCKPTLKDVENPSQSQLNPTPPIPPTGEVSEIEPRHRVSPGSMPWPCTDLTPPCSCLNPLRALDPLTFRLFPLSRDVSCNVPGPPAGSFLPCSHLRLKGDEGRRCSYPRPGQRRCFSFLLHLIRSLVPPVDPRRPLDGGLDLDSGAPRRRPRRG
mmetsp:Transcript_30662/g.55119  ORF Transcript_30662/g.55119 Transcript_30662/m.55119 type:complete len:233 (+) Transcript_30662:684-1382(+)